MTRSNKNSNLKVDKNMPRVSSWQLLPARLDLIREDFWSAITLLEGKKQVREFLSAFLTPDERTMLAKRFQVIMMLAQNYTYQEIRSATHISLSTISRIYSKMQDDPTGTLMSISKKILELKHDKAKLKTEFILKNPGDILTPLAKAGLVKLASKISVKNKKKSA